MGRWVQRWVQSPTLFSENNHSVIFNEFSTNFVRKINLTFAFHLVESQTCAVGGWGPMFGTKSQKKRFFLTPSLIFIQIQIWSVVGINNSTSPFTHRTLDSVFLSHLLPRNISYSNPPLNMMGDVSGKEDCQRHYGSRHRPTKSTIWKITQHILHITKSLLILQSQRLDKKQIHAGFFSLVGLFC